MKNSLLARFALIFVIIALASLIVWSYPRKGGIDLAGGTSLLYEVQVPENYQGDPAELAGKVIETLKKRIDPLAQKNLIWRVVGGRRIQLQIPLADPASRAARKEFRDAEKALREAAITQATIYSVTTSTGAERQAEIERATDAGARRDLLAKVGQTWDDYQAVQKERQALASAGKASPVELLQRSRQTKDAHDRAVREVLATNLDIAKFTSLLDAWNAGSENAKKEIDKLVAQYPAQKPQIDAVLKANASVQANRGKNADDPEDIQRQLQGRGRLDFRITVQPTDPDVLPALESLREFGPRRTIGSPPKRWMEIDRNGLDNFANAGYVTADWGAQKYVLLFDDPQHVLTHNPPTPDWKLTNAYLTQDNMGNIAVGFQFDAVGRRLFGELTTNNVREPMAILLDDRAISAPNINEPITGGSGQITFGRVGGTRTVQMIQDEASNLVKILEAGSLSAALSPEPISVVTIGPGLGADNIEKGVRSALYALIAVIIFMLIYYSIAGFFADVAVMLNLLITVAAMQFMGATFTLPGIAGLVLTLGMAVDANVLINERIREELHKGGSLWMAVKQGYDRVFWTIFDANLTTALTSIVLIFVGSEEVKGFGITLLIGLAISMFTALFVTRTLMIAAVRWNILRRIDDHSVAEYIRQVFTFTWLRKGQWPFMKVITITNVDWISKRYYFWAVSAAISIAGLAAFIARGPDKYDTEFRGGTQVTMKLQTKMDIEEVRKRVKAIGAENPNLRDASDATVQGLNNDDVTYQIETTIADDEARKIKLRQPFLDALADRFKDAMETKPRVAIAGWNAEATPVPLTATVVQDLRDAGKLVPITRASLEQNFDADKVTGIPARPVVKYLNGVAMYITDINPPQSAVQLTNRVDAAKRTAGGTYRSFEIVPVAGPDGVPETDPNKPVKSAVLLTADPTVTYEASNPLPWQRVAEEEWDALTAGLQSRSPFEAVNSIDAVVAGQAKGQALLAIILSLALIVVYVWVRFGGIRYGLGAILSLAHDTTVALAATVLAKYAAETWLGQKLLISDFKINLTMIAAYLTILGYSVNDTIVIFDRVRENRGKSHAPPTRKLVNDSINQCFGRTIWTSFTVFTVLLIMYVWGGEGIRGFAFAMLVGVITGVYSTLAIASPMLLSVDEKRTPSGPASPVDTTAALRPTA